MMNQPSIEEATARIVQLGERFSSVSRVYFRSRSGPGSRCGWSGAGEGSVTVVSGADNSQRFFENGHFCLDIEGAPPVAFSNVFCWKPCSDHVALSHERRGGDVWLFDLIASPEGDSADLVSREAHLCVEDRYQARLTFVDAGFDLEWIIDGPKKEEYLHYRYR
ncbi:hypothetical protein FGL86_02205 [Pistricoccus aurantiacus]|uniref:DUF6314 domain-containing protein n=1 Tax=Pistricoccus aurantiacus TaxID=1883414 RepID=A0A5B8SLL8_9GAMM|nr:DUF6314 family protein [Pistricoccus aurantiacus]QEA37999.1 hypothetical protein FGL86_02205 [Pistricoccus aurantiacus]